MPGRRTNLALLLLIPVAGISGIVAFAIGTSVGRIVVVAHGIAGIAVLLLAPWKSVIVRRGLGRRRPGRSLSVLLLLVVVVTMVSGFIQSTGVTSRLGPLTTMQVHVGSVVVSVVLALLHVRARPTRPRVVDLNRRALLRAGGLAIAGGAAYLATEATMRVLDLRGAERRFTGSHERGSFDPAAMPATQWFDDRTQHISPEAHRLRVHDHYLTPEALGEPVDGVVATLDCTSGWYSRQEWSGVALPRLIAGLSGSSILVRSVTGYSRRFPLGDAEHLLLATHVGGRPLSAGHGAPARLVAPGRRGFWWVKWVAEIRVDGRPPWWQSPFPLT